jgi:hypothetical protein
MKLYENVVRLAALDESTQLSALELQMVIIILVVTLTVCLLCLQFFFYSGNRAKKKSKDELKKLDSPF